MSIQEFVIYAGFIVSMVTGIAGWFWEFTTKDESGEHKHLTKAGRYAFSGAVAIFLITFISLVQQNDEKKKAAVQAAYEKAALEQRLSRLASSFDVSHIEIAFALDNDHELIRRLRDGRADDIIQVTSADSQANGSKVQQDALRTLIERSAKFSLWVAKKGFAGNDPLPQNYDVAVFTGQGSLYDSADAGVKWGIRSVPGPKRPPLPDGYTIIHMTVPESAVQIPGGFENIRSFYDLAGRTVFLQPNVGPIKLWYFRIYAKNHVQYPLFDSVKSESKATLPIEQGAFARIAVPSKAPWVPE
jgi:hypothetical protein